MNTTVRTAKGPLPAMDIGVPGLAIAGDHLTSGERCWAVFHAASGASVCWFDDPETAAKAALELGALTDWTATAQDLQTSGIDIFVYAITALNGGGIACSLGKYQS